MKRLLNTKIIFLFLLAGLAFSCKKNENKPADSTYDSIQNTIDTVGPEVDTLMGDTIDEVAIDTIEVKKDAVNKK
ncbi:hypothetical protein HNP37_001651 [Flavobacterium nitrogenifigens]|uniref:Uncharacterized protein n=2 Tax=Flavobacterium TaxID=237 RepID=A0A7W7N698_9FLAO|nr:MULTISPECIES: hypothetical protein [Flavobacterium]MBB4801590.1 hypothetical protein [Flavobacterium nitrogenifigens]MBB6386548.1 hypothetical protein [Flavobacterium notoginsengisoli]